MTEYAEQTFIRAKTQRRFDKVRPFERLGRRNGDLSALVGKRHRHIGHPVDHLASDRERLRGDGRVRDKIVIAQIRLTGYLGAECRQVRRQRDILVACRPLHHQNSPGRQMGDGFDVQLFDMGGNLVGHD